MAEFLCGDRASSRALEVRLRQYRGRGNGFDVCRLTAQCVLSTGPWPCPLRGSEDPEGGRTQASAPGAHPCHRLLGSSRTGWEGFTDWGWKQYD